MWPLRHQVLQGSGWGEHNCLCSRSGFTREWSQNNYRISEQRKHHELNNKWEEVYHTIKNSTYSDWQSRSANGSGGIAPGLQELVWSWKRDPPSTENERRRRRIPIHYFTVRGSDQVSWLRLLQSDLKWWEHKYSEPVAFVQCGTTMPL